MSRATHGLRGVLFVSMGIAIFSLVTGCGGYSYVYRSPVERPLEGVSRVGVRVEAHTFRDQEALGRTFSAQEDALVAWLGREGRALTFVSLTDQEDTSVVVRLELEPRLDHPDPYAVRTGSLRIAVRITIHAHGERVAIVEGTASTEIVAFHGLLDPDVGRTFERIAHRISRVLEDLGVPRR